MEEQEGEGNKGREKVKGEKAMTAYKAKSVVISRKPGKDRDGYWSAFIGLFDENNPHLKAKEPMKVVEIKDIEKVRIRDLRNISYYLMGNDIVINNLVELSIDVKEHIVTLTGRQELPPPKSS